MAARRVIITGIAGFVGSTLAERILETTPSTNIVGIDSFTDYYPRALKEQNVAALRDAGVTILEKDLVEADLDSLLDGAEVIYHQAGQPGVRPSWGTSFDAYLRDNILASQRLLESARRVATLKRFVYASSSSVYGDAERYPTLESDTPRPLSPYGVTKLAAEHLMSLYARNFGVPTISLRYFTVFGPRQRPDMAFTRFITSALTGRSIQIYGTGTQIRDFTFVEDVVRANLLAASVNNLQPGSVYNISGGSSVTLNDVLSILEDVIGERLAIERVDKVAGDVFRTGGSNDAASTNLGWKPQVGLREGLTQQIHWVEPRVSSYARLI